MVLESSVVFLLFSNVVRTSEPSFDVVDDIVRNNNMHLKQIKMIENTKNGLQIRNAIF
jgi:hypothetical protein